ncbi:MAG: hypothetical protein HC906_06945 [Bacteroidales bacterium]|nr:hypothetical protein [Bacteroidales bacterium]
MKAKLSKSTYFLILCFAFIISIHSAFAGDVRIGRIMLPSAYSIQGVPIPVNVKLKNDEAYPVTNLSISFEIRNRLNEILFDESYTNLTVMAGSQLECSTYPQMWTPNDTGKYKLIINSFSPVDIDLSNNSLEWEFDVVEKPKVRIEQLNLYEPFMIMNSLQFALGVEIPVKDDVTFLNVMARLPMSTNEQWIVQNMPLLPFHSQRITYYPFFAYDLGIEEGHDVDEIELSFSLSTRTKSNPFLTYSYELYPVYEYDYKVSFDNPEESKPR